MSKEYNVKLLNEVEVFQFIDLGFENKERPGEGYSACFYRLPNHWFVVIPKTNNSFFLDLDLNPIQKV